MRNELDSDPQRTKDAADERALRMAHVIADCADRVNARERLDVRRILAEHPDLAPELGQALSALGEVESIRAPRPEPIRTLGDYRLLSKLGGGGMGLVYRAWQLSLGREVAIKVLRPELVASLKAVERFKREAKVSARLQHPNIVSVYAMGIEGGEPYFAMEYVEGETLDRVVQRNTPPPRSGAAPTSCNRSDASSSLAGSMNSLFGSMSDVVEDRVTGGSPGGAATSDSATGSAFDSAVVDLKHCLKVAEAFAGVAEGLQFAHQLGVTHRDLKPSNLILDAKGRLRILDFGLAHLEGEQRITLSGDFIGTPLYMSPEQAMANRGGVDHRTDIYSVGATLYEVLLREPPFQGRDYRETLSQIISRDPPTLRSRNSRIPRSLETIVLKCLRKSPADRYGTAEALAQDLRRFVRGDPIEARPQSLIERLVQRGWRHKWRVLSVAATVLLVLTSGALINHSRNEARARIERYYAQEILSAVMRVEGGRPVARRIDTRPTEPVEVETAALSSFPVAVASTIETADDARSDPVADAVAQLTHAIEQGPRRPDGLYHRARARRLLGDRAGALADLDAALVLDPSFVPALALRDALHEESGETRSSTQSGSAARSGASALDWRSAWSLAHRSMLRGEWAIAAGGFSAILDAEERGAEPYLGAAVEARLGRGRMRLEDGNLDGAVRDFSAAQALWSSLLEPSLLLGKTYLRSGKSAQAAEIFDDLLRRARDRSEVTLRIAGVFSGERQIDAALAWAEKAAHSPARERVRAHLLAARGDLDLARAAGQTAVDLDARDARAHETLGYVHHLRGDLESSRTEFDTALGIDPQFLQAHNSLACTLEALGRAEDAERTFRAAIDSHPRSALLRRNLASLLLRQSKVENAIVELRAAIGAAPADALSHSYLGEALRQGKKLDDALRAHDEAVHLDPRSPAVRHNRALTLNARGKKEEAEAEFRKAVELDARFLRSHAALANIYEGQKRYEEAVGALRGAIAAEPDDFRLHARLGALLARRMKRFPEAVEQYRDSIALEPKQFLVRYNLMLALKELGKNEDALEAAREVLDVAEKSPELAQKSATARESLVHVLNDAAKISLKAGRLEDARGFTRRAIALQKERAERPDATAAELNQYAALLLECEPEDLRNPPEALPSAEKAVKLSEGKDPEILDSLAQALFETGDRNGAVATQEKAIALLPTDATDRRNELLRKVLEANLQRFRAGRSER